MNPAPQPQHAPDRDRSDWALAVLGAGLLALAMVWMVQLLGMPGAVPAPVPLDLPALTTADSEPPPTLRDEAFGVVLPARALRRVVQMLQWREVASVPSIPGDEIVLHEGEYQLIWSERMIDSSRFAHAQGHANPPPPPYRSIGMGPAELLDVDAGAAAGWDEVPAAAVMLPDNLAAVFRAQGRWLVTTPEHELPQAGDLRVRFEAFTLDQAAASTVGTGRHQDDEKLDEDFVATALVWMARLAAFILALLGAGLMLQAGARLVPPRHRLAQLPGIAILALSAWAAVGAVFVAILGSRLL